ILGAKRKGASPMGGAMCFGLTFHFAWKVFAARANFPMAATLEHGDLRKEKATTKSTKIAQKELLCSMRSLRLNVFFLPSLGFGCVSMVNRILELEHVMLF